MRELLLEIAGFACVVFALGMVDYRLGLAAVGAGLLLAAWSLDR